MARNIFLFLILAALGPALPAAAQDSTIVITPGLELVRITDSVWRHVSYQEFPDGSRVPANGLLYRNGKQVLVVDTPWNDELTDALVSWVEQTWRARVSNCVVTHWHDDCMGGIWAVIRRGIPTTGHRLTGQIAEEKGLMAPNGRFLTTLRGRLGGFFFECAYHGGGHTIDNIVVWLPNERVLFGGCLVRAMSFSGLGNIDDAVLDQWPETIRAVRDAYPDAAIVVPGHGVPGGPELLDHTLDLLERRGD